MIMVSIIIMMFFIGFDDVCLEICWVVDEIGWIIIYIVRIYFFKICLLFFDV